MEQLTVLLHTFQTINVVTRNDGVETVVLPHFKHGISFNTNLPLFSCKAACFLRNHIIFITGLVQLIKPEHIISLILIRYGYAVVINHTNTKLLQHNSPTGLLLSDMYCINRDKR